MTITCRFLLMWRLRTREKIDIVKLNAEIAQIVARENELRAAIDQIVAEIEG